MGNIAAVAITTASLFLLVVGVLLNSAPLFYMSMALVGTIIATRWQAWYAAKDLRFERRAPSIVRVGDIVTIELISYSLKAVQRPLVVLRDHLPKRLLHRNRSYSVPVAPSFGEPVISKYSFEILKRGKYVWDSLTAIGTDAFGIARTPREYKTEPTEMTVLPTPIPIDIEFPAATGWGFEETEGGLSRGQGMEPRGVREYVPGDSQRNIHWKSSARSDKLMVKEYETGSQSAIALMAQRVRGSDVGEEFSTLDHICGNISYLIEKLCRKNIEVYLPGLVETNQQQSQFSNEWDLQVALAEIEANQSHQLSSEVIEAQKSLPTGTAYYLFVTTQDEKLPSTCGQLLRSGSPVTVVICDVERYGSKGSKKASHYSLNLANEISFIQELQASGAVVEVIETGVRI